MTLALCNGSTIQVKALSLFFVIQRDFHEKLGLQDLGIQYEEDSLSKDEFQFNVYKIYRHTTWYLGHYAYNSIMIKTDKKNEKKDAQS